MSIEIALLISIVSAAFGVAGTVIGIRRNKTADDKKEASEMTTVIIKLESISSDTAEIKNDMKGVKGDVKHNSEQIIRMDESLKSAWKAINRLQGGDGE